MSLLEALTMTSGLVYLVLLLWQGRSGWGWTLSLLLAAALWLLFSHPGGARWSTIGSILLGVIVLAILYSPKASAFFRTN